MIPSGSSKLLVTGEPNWLGVMAFGKGGLVLDLTSQCEIPLYGLGPDGRVKAVHTLKVTKRKKVYLL